VIHDPGVGVGDRHGRVRNYAAATVGHRADNGSFLRCRSKGKQKEQKTNKSEKSGGVSLLTANQTPR
jgi:hypothetical protein